MAAHGKIFVSYRREDAPGDARSIYERLGRSFGEAKVFMDVDQLLAGQRFDRELDKALVECDVLIAVIGPRWMDLLSECAQLGKRDYVRDEIAAALQRDIIVVPVMMGREASMPPLPRAQDLPENIRDLVLYQKHNIAHESFGRDAAHLIAALKSLLRERRGPRRWRTIAVAGMSGLALTGVLLGYWTVTAHRVQPSTQRLMDEVTIAALPKSDTDKAVEPTVGADATAEPKSAIALAEPAPNIAAAEPKSVIAPAEPAPNIAAAKPKSAIAPAAPASIGFAAIAPAEPAPNIAAAEPKSGIAPAEPAPNIAGRWRDDRGTTYDVKPEGRHAFRYSASGPSCRPGYNFTSSGRGTMNRLSFESNYQSDHVTKNRPRFGSLGNCRGILSSDGTKMTSSCTDLVCGVNAYSLTKQ